MLISRVELENIKSYETGDFEFSPGVTAISGPNGAGKTTILEAIAWALFDHLPYKKEDFLRRGAKKGAVRVTFVSSIDGREYTVYRDTGSGYYIYDPITKMRLVEQKSQVSGWIKQHLGVEPGVDLKSLFTSTIGVPQGTFAVDFADQPARRKVSFDKVLRVDEYQRSSEDLRSIVRLVETREYETREEIARVEVELAALEGLVSENVRFESLRTQLETDLAVAESQREMIRADLFTQDQLKKDIERLTGEFSALSSRLEEIAARRENLRKDVDRARRAQEAVEASTSGYESYNDSTRRITELEPRLRERDIIKKELSEKEREGYQIEASLQGTRDNLKQIEADKTEIERLRPLIGEQERLETRRSDVQKLLGHLGALEERYQAGEKELQTLRKEFAGISRQIDEAEKLRESAESVPLLEKKRVSSEVELREMRVALERLGERKREYNRLRDVISRFEGEIHTLEREIDLGGDAEKQAEKLPQLEADSQTVTEEVAAVKEIIKREKEILSQVKDGLCPLLAQRCLNMREGEGLDQYFKVQVGSALDRLAAIEVKKKAVLSQLAEARKALKIASALDSKRVQLGRIREDLEINRRDAARIEGEIKDSKVSEGIVGKLEEALNLVNDQLIQAQEARGKYEAVGPLRERLDRLKIEGTERRNAQTEIKARIDSHSGLTTEMVTLEVELRKLDDPRGRVRMLNHAIEKEKEVRSLLEDYENKSRSLELIVTELKGRIEEFQGLDDAIFSERERRAASERDYLTYIENQPISALLIPREAELAEVDEKLETFRAELEKVNEELELKRSKYNYEKHLALAVDLEQLINRVASISTELKSVLSRLEELKIEIDRLKEVRDRMESLLVRSEQSKQLLSISEFIRDILRKAGPFITEAHLQSISIEANQLYREITGNPMVSLRWDMGYEVVQEEDGHERSFASLSGGEQMAAALSIRLALLKELSDMRVAFFDEPTTNMDEERRRNLAQQIGRIKDFDQLFVISHDDAFEGFTDRVVSVRGTSDGA